RLARAGDAEQRLVALAGAQAGHELGDRLRLVARGRVRCVETEAHGGTKVADGTVGGERGWTLWAADARVARDAPAPGSGWPRPGPVALVRRSASGVHRADAGRRRGAVPVPRLADGTARGAARRHVHIPDVRPLARPGSWLRILAWVGLHDGLHQHALSAASGARLLARARRPQHAGLGARVGRRAGRLVRMDGVAHRRAGRGPRGRDRGPGRTDRHRRLAVERVLGPRDTAAHAAAARRVRRAARAGGDARTGGVAATVDRGRAARALSAGRAAARGAD